MSKGILKYRMVTRMNPQNKSEQPKWYAKAVQDRTIDFEDLVTHMSEHNSPYSRGVIHGVMTDMLDCVKELVLDGKSVRLGDLGLFSVGLKTKGAVTRDKWTVASHVQGVTLNVRNTKTWSNAELRKNTTLQELIGYDNGKDEGDDDFEEPIENPESPNPGGNDQGGSSNNPSGGSGTNGGSSNVSPDPEPEPDNGDEGGEPEQIFIGTSVNDSRMGSVSGMGTYDKGTTVTLKATANAGYRFVSWGDDVTENPRVIKAEVNGATYSAIFEAVA